MHTHLKIYNLKLGPIILKYRSKNFRFKKKLGGYWIILKVIFTSVYIGG
jgi:hypothetical protein